MKLISWNVNGLRACLTKGFEEFFRFIDADIFCLQETKLQPEQVTFCPEGYERYFFSAEKKGYSGTAIYTKRTPVSVVYGIEGEYADEGRVITAEYEDFYLVCCYSPNVKRELTRIPYRMDFEDALRAYLKKLNEKKGVLLCGDLNVAHTEQDIKNAKSNIGNAGFTYEERGKMTELLQAGFFDTYRTQHPDDNEAFTWWSYRFNARERNIGWRLDYFIASDDMKDRVKNSFIYREITGSDHCPVGIEL